MEDSGCRCRQGGEPEVRVPRRGPKGPGARALPGKGSRLTGAFGGRRLPSCSCRRCRPAKAPSGARGRANWLSSMISLRSHKAMESDWVGSRRRASPFDELDLAEPGTVRRAFAQLGSSRARTVGVAGAIECHRVVYVSHVVVGECYGHEALR